MLDYSQIKDLINTIDNSTLRIFELECENIKLKLSKNDESLSKSDKVVNNSIPSVQENVKKSFKEETVKETSKEALKESTSIDKNVNIVKSPLVGTYYSSPTPGGKPYVEVGSKVKKGDKLCIVEAMKIMNEILSDFDGEVVEVLRRDEDIVEFGMPLFKIK
jgi:acetyl-CoA carboxylase biotin carboxyl carrier protein